MASEVNQVALIIDTRESVMYSVLKLSLIVESSALIRCCETSLLNGMEWTTKLIARHSTDLAYII